MTEKPKRKMKPGGGKAKGSGFEGQIAKKLSAALSPLNFIRTQGSGARVGGKNFETIGQMFGEDALKLFVGDVVPVNEKILLEQNKHFAFSVECKFYKTQDSFTSLVSGSSNVFKWMQEAVDDAVKINKIPLLIFKWNNTPIFAATLSKYIDSEVANLVLRQGNSEIHIFYMDDLLQKREFWIREK